NHLAMFMYALKAPESKRQYPKRLKIFLDFLTSKNELSQSNLDNQCREFMAKSVTDQKWANNKLMEFVMYQKERVYKDEIVYATIRNYLKTVKLFLEMNSDIPIVNWKRYRILAFNSTGLLLTKSREHESYNYNIMIHYEKFLSWHHFHLLLSSPLLFLMLYLLP
ncbi:MAG: uncharacterized protein K0S93_1740, partial [Nitrososphaeraceae archaeon]|nr:uncharacterized protein [Nitrososphaeraceae archaeon]